MELRSVFAVVCSLFVVPALVASADTEPDRDTEYKAHLVTGHAVATAQFIAKSSVAEASSEVDGDEEIAEVFDDTSGVRVETGVGAGEDRSSERRGRDETDEEVVDYDMTMTVELAEGSFGEHFGGVERALRRLHNNVGACYEDRAGQQTELEGEAHVTVTVVDVESRGNRGEIEDVVPTGDRQLSDGVAQCIAREINDGRVGRLPPPVAEDENAEAVVKVTYDFHRQ